MDERERDLQTLRRNAADSIVASQERNKTNFDGRHKAPKSYKEGDYVMIINTDVTPGVNKKLLPKYRGPYVVAKCLSHDRYLIKDIEGFQITQIPFEGVFEAGRMKPWQSNSNSTLPVD